MNRSVVWFALQAVAVAAGIWFGVWLFQTLTA